jgi:hypothetical protein
MAQHHLETLVRDVPEPIDVVSEPREAAWERGGHHGELSRFIDELEDRRGQIVRVGDGGIGDEEEPLDRAFWLVRIRARGPGVWARRDRRPVLGSVFSGHDTSMLATAAEGHGVATADRI